MYSFVVQYGDGYLLSGVSYMSQDNEYTPDEFIEFFISSHAPQELPEGWMIKSTEEALSDALEKVTCTISTDKNGFRIYTLWAD